MLKSKTCPAGLMANIEKAKLVMANLQDMEVDDDPNVIYALIDSGSGIHAINSKTLPWILQSKGKRMKCQTANGDVMEVEGEQTLKFTTDEGHKCAITFKNCDVAMPIISVLELAKKSHRIILEEDGGHIEHLATGQITRIIERDGVYFLKMIIDDPNFDPDFTRQGNAA